MYRYAPLLDAADASARPCARANHAACASAIGDTMFVFGGEDAADRLLDDLWALHAADAADGGAPPRWQLLNEAEAGVLDRPQPCVRTGATMVASADGSLWLFGGDAGAQNGGRLNDMWRWPRGAVGRAWERVETVGTSPPPCVNHTACVRGDYMLVYGGWDWENSFSDVYLFHVASSSWRQLPFDAPTAERVRHTTVVNPRTGVAHAFGGEDRNRYLQNAMFAIGVNDESGRGSFELVNCGAVPSERFGHAAAYHAPSATMLVCAGYAGDMAMASDLFQFNFEHCRWRALADSTPPDQALAGRHGHSLVALAGGRLVVFGGSGCEMQKFADVVEIVLENNGEWVYDAASEQASQWACDVCTFSENAAYTAECQVCGTPQAPPPPPPPQLRQDEQHGAAEYAPFHDPHAAAVEQQQKQQQPDDGGDAAAWACGVCTFENDGAYRDCEMCGAAREL